MQRRQPSSGLRAALPKQGQIAARWILDHTDGKVRVVELTGAPGASASIERSKGFHDAVDAEERIEIIAQESANFEHDPAKQIMDKIIQSRRATVTRTKQTGL